MQDRGLDRASGEGSCPSETEGITDMRTREVREEVRRGRTGSAEGFGRCPTVRLENSSVRMLVQVSTD